MATITKISSAASAGSRPRGALRSEAGASPNVVALVGLRSPSKAASPTLKEKAALAKFRDAKTRVEVLRQLAAEVRGEIHTARLGLGRCQKSPNRATALQAFLDEVDQRRGVALRLLDEHETYLVALLEGGVVPCQSMGRD